MCTVLPRLMEKHERDEILSVTANLKEEERKKASPPSDFEKKTTFTRFLGLDDDYLYRHMKDVNEHYCYVLVHDGETNEIYEYKNQDIGE